MRSGQYKNNYLHNETRNDDKEEKQIIIESTLLATF